MKKLLKKVLCLSMVALVAALVVGCGNDSDIAGSSAGNSKENVSSNTTDAVVSEDKYNYDENDDEKTLTIFGVYDKKAKIYDIPSEIENKQVTAINQNAFGGMNNIEEVIVPGTVKKIGDAAFAFEHNLKKITFKEGVKEIGSICFGEDTALTEVILPNSLEKIGNDAFSTCESLEKITIPVGVKRIETNTFAGCPKLKEVHLSDSVEFIQSEVEADGIYSAFDQSPNVTIYAPKGSYAEKYAKQENIKFVAE